MRRKLYLILTVILMTALLIPGFIVQADTTDYYYYQGTGVSGHSNTMKINMTESYFAFCVDQTTVIKTSVKYIAKELEDGFDLANAERIRAILNYSWDKTAKLEITAIQYALWNVMHGTTLPSRSSLGATVADYEQISAIYNLLIAMTGIPASDASITNVLTLTDPDPSTKVLGDSPDDYSFDFKAASSTGAAISFKVFDSSDTELPGSAYSITDNGSGNYTLTLLNIGSVTTFKLTATSLNNKAVNAVLFVSGSIIDEEFVENRKLSQTVVGINYAETTQSKLFTVGFEDPPAETTPPETTPPETTASETTVAETTIVQTTAQATTTYIELTTESIPLATTSSDPTTILLTTESIPLATTSIEPTTILLTTDYIPQAGETPSSNNGLIIGIMLLLLAGGLTIVVHRSKPIRE